MLSTHGYADDSVVWNATRGRKFRYVRSDRCRQWSHGWRVHIVVETVDPFIAVVLEIRVKIVQVQSRGWVLQLVIERSAEAIALALVAIFADVHAVIDRRRPVGVRLRLDVVDPPPVVIVAAGKQGAETMIRAE